MIRELNDLARLEEKVEMEKMNIAPIGEESFESFKPSFESKGIKATSSIPEKAELECNEGLIRKLFSIVLENASKYALRYVDFQMKSEQSRIVIICKNDANLASNGSLDRVFERFYRSDEAPGSDIEGSGIGLSIAKGIVTQLGGRIYAHGENGDFVLKIEL